MHDMALNELQCFYLLMEKTFGGFLRSGSTMQAENTYFCILKVTGQIWESRKKDKCQH